ncbi:MAG TPA: serine/threonine-protein kinase [Candidatus Angelobacter sp.]|nr:serine/threonine-protein kinase [Candidatus Angelobacter sp.]
MKQTMETARFAHLQKIFCEAVALPSTEWSGFARRACEGDEGLYADVMGLLMAHQSTDTTERGTPQMQMGAMRMIGPYRILRELGAGGMGVVHLAVRDDGAFRKNVAVKVLKANQDLPDFVQRFHLERQVLANLDHPNIARILDGGQTAEGLPYHVMEYVEGLTLDRFCDTQKLDLAERIRLFQQVVSAVSYLHENLVVHRDLKPSNILVTAEGQVKLLDFGIAKTQAVVSMAPDLTAPATRMLTPSYASPEQMAGAPITRTSDIYSLGIILYELLTGRLPYRDSVEKLMEEPPLPSANIRDDLRRTQETTAQLRRRIVGDLDQIVLLCLRRNPRHRYASANALAEDLSLFLDGKPVLARKARMTERALRFVKRNRIAVAMSMLVMATLGVGVWQTVSAQFHARMTDARENAIRNTLEALERNGPKPGAGAASGAGSGSKTDSKTGSKTEFKTESKTVSNGAPNLPRVDEIRKLRDGLAKELVPEWSNRPSLTPERKALLERAGRYLDSIRPYVAQNALLAPEIAGAYQQLGALSEPFYHDFAMLSYRSAAQTLQQVSKGDPNQGPYQMQWEVITARITSMGGTIPLFSPATPLYSPMTSDKSSPKPTPGNASLPPHQTTVAPERPPIATASPEPTPDPGEYAALENRLDLVAGKVKLADETFVRLKQDLESSGQTLHPDITSNHLRMQTSMDSARHALERGDLAAARTSLESANECARRVMKETGR